MNRFRITDCIMPTSIAIVVIVVALLAAMPTFNSFAASQDLQKEGSTADNNGELVELAELRLSIVTQQIAVANAEMELLEPTQQAADQKVATVEANLATAIIEAENSAKLFKQKIIAEEQMRLTQSKRDAVAAEVKMAQAQRDMMSKSGKVQQAKLKVLQLREKVAGVELRNLKREFGFDQ